MSKQWLARGIVLMVSVAGLAGVSAQPAPDTAARLKAEGVIRLGVRDSAPPFAYLDQNGQPAGFTWELCRALVKNLEAELKRPLEIKTVPVSLNGSFDLLKEGRIDLQCGSTTHTVERAREVDFSDSFFVSGIAVAHRKDDMLFADPLHFGRVAVVAGSRAATLMTKRMAAKGKAAIDAVVVVKSHQEGVDKLKNKEVDTLYAESLLIPLDAAIERRRTLETVEPYALMLRKGDRAFGEMVDRALMKVLASPAVRQFAAEAKLDGKLNGLTTEAWRRPSKEPAPTMLY